MSFIDCKSLPQPEKSLKPGIKISASLNKLEPLFTGLLINYMQRSQKIPPITCQARVHFNWSYSSAKGIHWELSSIIQTRQGFFQEV